MKIHGLCLAKNEGDLMDWSLRDKLGWCDFIYVYDNGSTDDTWEIAQHWAAREPERIFAFRSEARPFHDGLRAAMFNAYRGKARPGDWWCRADVDEFFIDPPREFLAAVPRRHQVVWTVHVQYLFTVKDLERFEAAGGVCRIPEDLPRYYVANYSEPRFFRHREGMAWREDAAWPEHLGVVEPRRIGVRHYQFRSPPQIERRLATRREAAAQGWAHFPHSQAEHWRDKIDPVEELHYDAGDGKFVIDEAAMPRHLEKPAQRLVKMAMHGLGIWA